MEWTSGKEENEAPRVTSPEAAGAEPGCRLQVARGLKRSCSANEAIAKCQRLVVLLWS